jgi:LppX_LprAFG lipoprotein
VIRTYLLLCILFVTLLVGCGGSKEAPPANQDPVELLNKASAATQALNSFHFKLTHENGSTPLPLNLSLQTAEGDVVIPGRLAADIGAKAAGSIPVSVKVIAIDDKTWITNPFTREWQPLPGAGLRDFADPEALVRALVAEVANPQIDGGSKIDGVQTVKLVGTIDAGLLQDALGIARAGNTVQVEAWIGESDSLPRRIRILGRLSTVEAEDVTRQIDLSAFNQPVEINPP